MVILLLLYPSITHLVILLLLYLVIAHIFDIVYLSSFFFVTTL